VSDVLQVAVDGGVARVTINRPDKLNALNGEVMAALDGAFAEFGADAAVRAIVLTGAGEKAFVAGADIKELSSLSPLECGAIAARGQQVFARIERLGKPVIAAINGFALGGGLEMALACTFRTASTKARLGLPEITLGILPGYGGTQRLPRVVGRGRALEMMLTGEPIDAQEAFRIGLVNRVFEPEQLLPETLKIAAKLAKQAPVAARSILQAVNDGNDQPLAAGLALEAALFGQLASSADTKEGLQAFVEKRAARFVGK
jgi:enoyl-CoA hydratase